MSRRILTVIAALAALSLTACGDPKEAGTPARPEAPSTTTALPDGERRIAFVGERDGVARLYTMRPDGSDVRLLSPQQVELGPFAVSRDGTQIVAVGVPDVREEGASPVVYRFDVIDGSMLELGSAPPTSNDMLVPAPYWTDDDAALMFNDYVCHAFPSTGGAVRERDASECFEALMLAPAPGERWATNLGESLATGVGEDPASLVVLDRVIDPASLEDAGLAALGIFAAQAFGIWRPVWSPDYKQIAYLDFDAVEGRAGLSIIDASGGTPRLLIESSENVANATTPAIWLEDGTIIVSGYERGASIRAVDVESAATTTLIGDDGHTYMSPRLVVAAKPPDGEVETSPDDEATGLDAELARAPGRLIYEGGTGRPGMFTARPDGTGETAVNGDSGHPLTISGDGSRIAYHKRDSAAFRDYVVIVDVDAGTRREIDGFDPALSHSGQQLAYWTGWYDEGWTLRVLDLDSGEEQEIAYHDGFGPLQAAWSHDDRRLAFYRGGVPDELPALTVVDPSDGSFTVVAVNKSQLNASAPIAWSPDDASIAFDDDIVRIAASDGSAVDDMEFYGDSAAWSPDGSKLAVRGAGLLLYDVETGDIERLTSDISGLVDHPPAWSPDGAWLAYTGLDEKIHMLHVETGGIVRLDVDGEIVHWIAE